jgi:6-pyruvoyltetrahydropterin/6-carboxytetrahydropterin synthase
MKLTRVYRFCASHRLHADELSAEQNRQLYGKCNNPFGHGHNYVLHVRVSGSVDRATGRLINPGEMDRYVRDRVIRVFDHVDMNRDVPDFAGVPTTENLAFDIERRLRQAWNGRFGPARLDRVWIQETPRNTFELKSSGE